MRDSTWHRIGPKNARFVLVRREEPNGVHVDDRGGGCGGCDGGGGEGVGEGGNGIPAAHENNDAACSLVFSQADAQMTTGTVCSTPTYDATAENTEGDNTNDTRSGAGCGCPSDFKTPEPRPGGASDACGGRNPPHRRARYGGGSGSANSSTAGGNGGRGGNDAGGRRDGGEGRCFSKARRGPGRDVPAGVAARGTPYRMQLFISAQQRQAAESAVAGRTTEARAVAAAAAGEEGGEGVEDVVNISCSASDGCDMYQLGRMEGGENDFAVRGPLHQSKPGGKVCGPVSRYAVRLLVDRAPPNRCRVFAGGFNSR